MGFILLFKLILITLAENKYQFFCENHDNIFAMQKVARYIEENFQVGDIILIEGELAGREIPQEKSLVKTIKFISKKVRVMGWDNYQYSKSLDLQSDNPIRRTNEHSNTRS